MNIIYPTPENRDSGLAGTYSNNTSDITDRRLLNPRRTYNFF